MSENKKFYAQALKLLSNVKEILKIKKTFPSLQANKIESIQKWLIAIVKLNCVLTWLQKDLSKNK